MSGWHFHSAWYQTCKSTEPYLVVLIVASKAWADCMAGYPSADHHCCQEKPDLGDQLIRTLGGGKKEELLKIVLPSSVPLILANMKVNIGLCLVGVIIGEFIGARQGLGYLIIYGSQTFQ